MNGHHIPPPASRRGDHWDGNPTETLLALAEALLSVRGEASGVALARDVLERYTESGPDQKRAFFEAMAERLNPDEDALEAAWARYKAGERGALPQLIKTVEPPRQEFFRRLNLAPGGTAALVRMRADLLGFMRSSFQPLDAVDADLRHLLKSWFNRGFLTMQPISWSTPAQLLERVIQFDAVRDIDGWDDLRQRLDPSDRRCYSFIHPAMPNELLIFVEVALTQGIADNVQNLLSQKRQPISAYQADTAVFYSINSCHDGLRGIAFGHFLIKQVVADLKRELPNIERFVTLSPIPGFLDWRQQASGMPLGALKDESLQTDITDERRDQLISQVAEYLVHVKDGKGRPFDPVARFHLSNGARLERLNWLGDRSAKGMRQSAGITANYLYDLPTIEENHEAYREHGTVITGAEIRQLLRMQKEAPSKDTVI